MKKYILLIFLFLFHTFSFAQNSPKREFRAVWIAHVENIDFPTQKTFSPETQRQEFVQILDAHQRNGINAVLVQVRPSADAIFPSPFEPWSEWLTGTQGKAPEPLYDPLAFMIEEAHKRNMEFHAWFNPYRAVTDSSKSSIAVSHISKTQPKWIIPYNKKKLLDPGLPEVRDYILRIVQDVAKRYDIDGVHFDDYFYPYPETGFSFADDSTFKKHARGFTNKDDWRRDNVNLLIKNISESLKNTKPYIKFGISPFGVWRNLSSDPKGSNTRAFEGYSGIYGDALKWLQEGWIDYVTPQIYWTIGFSVADFQILVPWWAKNTNGRHLYVGQAAYRVNDQQTTDANWRNLAQMPNQMRLLRQTANVQGSVFFSSKSITNNLGGFQDSLRNNFYKTPALPPIMAWKDATPPASPNVVAEPLSDGVKINFQAKDADTQYFMIYELTNPNQSIDDPKLIRYKTKPNEFSFTDKRKVGAGQNLIYAVTALDRLHNESTPSISQVLITANDLNPLWDFQFYAPIPNPASERVLLVYSLPTDSFVKIRAYNLSANTLQSIETVQKQGGRFEQELDIRDWQSGIYMLSLETQFGALVQKLIVE